jgi:hypothetical protein
MHICISKNLTLTPFHNFSIGLKGMLSSTSLSGSKPVGNDFRGYGKDFKGHPHHSKMRNSSDSTNFESFPRHTRVLNLSKSSETFSTQPMFPILSILNLFIFEKTSSLNRSFFLLLGKSRTMA